MASSYSNSNSSDYYFAFDDNTGAYQHAPVTPPSPPSPVFGSLQVAVNSPTPYTDATQVSTCNVHSANRKKPVDVCHDFPELRG